MKTVVTRQVSQDLSPLHSHPLLHRIYAARGVKSSAELEHDLKYLLPFGALKDVDKASEILALALREQWRVLVVGDFDTDGATSTALAVLALRVFGLNNISYLIPNRFTYGYGLTKEIVELALQQKPQLIITVDNGITSIEGVSLANSHGIKVIITDHHLPGDELPDAVAIVNPNQVDDAFASKYLAGVGVIFYLMLALRAHLRDLNWFREQNIFEPNMAQFLDLVAFGTIADAVPLDKNNRIMVLAGLERIKSGKGRLGITTILASANRSYSKISEHDFGYVVAPRLNAAGRLDDMSRGVELLLTDDSVAARQIASKLNSLNNERREIEGEMQAHALRILDTFQLDQSLPAGVCVFEESWHQGVLGILATRLKDRLNRPVIAFASVNDNEIKGSARSVDEVHIRDLLSSIAVKNPGLITKFGGHAMAAGLSLARENYEAFSAIFAEEVEKVINLESLKGVIYTDGELNPEELGMVTAELIKNSGPWGSGFVEPQFYGEFILIRQSLVGEKHLKLVLRHPSGGQNIDGIHFNADLKVWPNRDYSKLNAVYRLGINEYNGKRSLQLIISEVIGYE